MTITEGKKLIKNFPLTVVKKSYHKSVLYDVKSLYEKLQEINPYLFNAVNSYWWIQYKKAVEEGQKKTYLDHYLKMTLKWAHEQLCMIELGI